MDNVLPCHLDPWQTPQGSCQHQRVVCPGHSWLLALDSWSTCSNKKKKADLATFFVYHLFWMWGGMGMGHLWFLLQRNQVTTGRWLWIWLMWTACIFLPFSFCFLPFLPPYRGALQVALSKTSWDGGDGIWVRAGWCGRLRRVRGDSFWGFPSLLVEVSWVTSGSW